MTTKTHELKTWVEFFGAVADHRKRFELRRDDRGFNVGDELWLREWYPGLGYTGRELRKRVSYIFRGGQFGLEPGFVIMSIE